MEELLLAQEVSQVLRIKLSAVYAGAADGRIPCIRLWEGQRRALIRFRRADIEQLIRERRRPTQKEG